MVVVNDFELTNGNGRARGRKQFCRWSKKGGQCQQCISDLLSIGNLGMHDGDREIGILIPCTSISTKNVYRMHVRSAS
jgi:hypothetical protein